MRRIEAYWNKREPRERMLIAICLVLAAAVALSNLVVRPLLAVRAEARADIRTYEGLNARLRAAGPALGGQGNRRGGDAMAMLTGSASEYGIALQGSEPEGEAIRVGIAEVPFDALVRWIADIEGSSDLRVIEARLERGPATGLVSARLLVAL